MECVSDVPKIESLNVVSFDFRNIKYIPHGAHFRLGLLRALLSFPLSLLSSIIATALQGREQDGPMA